MTSSFWLAYLMRCQSTSMKKRHRGGNKKKWPLYLTVPMDWGSIPSHVAQPPPPPDTFHHHTTPMLSPNFTWKACVVDLLLRNRMLDWLDCQFDINIAHTACGVADCMSSSTWTLPPKAYLRRAGPWNSRRSFTQQVLPSSKISGTCNVPGLWTCLWWHRREHAKVSELWMGWALEWANSGPISIKHKLAHFRR